MFTLIDYHFFKNLSRGILLFLKFISLFGVRFCAFLLKTNKVAKKTRNKQKTTGKKEIPFLARYSFLGDFLIKN
jgi:hypothetical protein